MKLLLDKVALVTGAAHELGMGFNTAKKLAEAGAKVVLSDLPERQEEVEARVLELSQQGYEVMSMVLDVTDSSQAKVCVEAAVQKWGHIDILFNNAGSPDGVGAFLEMTDAQWDSSYQVNIKGPVSLCRAVIPFMKKQGGGVIINNASLLGLGSKANLAGYCATKAALISLSKTLAAEFAEDNIRVNAICPGNIWTQMSELEVKIYTDQGQNREQVIEQMGKEVPIGRWGKATDVANSVVFLCSEHGSYITGAALPVAGALVAGL
ncbi:MAG: SDR family NAD(P)-dependent oxidoreductase [Pseudomonadales bacterium]